MQNHESWLETLKGKGDVLVTGFCISYHRLLCHSLVRSVILFTIDHSQKEKQTFRKINPANPRPKRKTDVFISLALHLDCYF